MWTDRRTKGEYNTQTGKMDFYADRQEREKYDKKTGKTGMKHSLMKQAGQADGTVCLINRQGEKCGMEGRIEGQDTQACQASRKTGRKSRPGSGNRSDCDKILKSLPVTWVTPFLNL
jgi:hypothetical protein